jgi:hypothetical protein
MFAWSRSHNPPRLMSWAIGEQDLEDAINKSIPAWIKHECCHQGQAGHGYFSRPLMVSGHDVKREKKSAARELEDRDWKVQLDEVRKSTTR